MPVLEMHIRISPGTKFQNKLLIFIFSTKSTQKGYLQSKSEQVNITTEFFIFKLEENNDIFLAGGDALVFLAEPMHKKYSTTFAWGHPFSTLKYDGNIVVGHIEIFQSHVVEKIFQNLRVRLKFNTL